MGTYHDEPHTVLDSSVKGELESSPRIPPMKGTLFSKYHLGLWVSPLQGVWLEILKKSKVFWIRNQQEFGYEGMRREERPKG